MKDKNDYLNLIGQIKLMRKKGYRILIVKNKWLLLIISFLISLPHLYTITTDDITEMKKMEQKFSNYNNYLVKISAPKLINIILPNITCLKSNINLNSRQNNFHEFYHLGSQDKQKFEMSLLSSKEIRTSKEWTIHKSESGEFLILKNDKYKLLYMLNVDAYAKEYHFTHFNKVGDYKNGNIYVSLTWYPNYLSESFNTIVKLIFIQGGFLFIILIHLSLGFEILKKNRTIYSVKSEIIYDYNKINIVLIDFDNAIINLSECNSRKLFTEPQHFLDRFLWPLLRLIWEPFSKKRSHWWHWRDSDSIAIQTCLEFRGNSLANSRSGFWNNLWQTNFGWKSALIIKPELSTKYKIGFFNHKGAKICSIIMDGEIALLEGPDPVNFFAFSYPENEPIGLEIVKNNVPKKDIPKNIYLF